MSKVITERQARKMLVNHYVESYTAEFLADAIVAIVLCENAVGPSTYKGLKGELEAIFEEKYIIVENNKTTQTLFEGSNENKLSEN